ncbi:MAG: hypothetical protein Q4A05_10780 [Ruminococcus sp.]|nr:hypothetical protein [Ruminococcus sp.]
MGKMYTLNKKLLIGSPEIRIGEKVYAVDDRTKNVKKILKLFKDIKGDNDESDDKIDEALKLAFGKNYKEIEELNMPYAAYQQLVEIVVAALTGEDLEKEGEDKSFPEE